MTAATTNPTIAIKNDADRAPAPGTILPNGATVIGATKPGAYGEGFILADTGTSYATWSYNWYGGQPSTFWGHYFTYKKGDTQSELDQMSLAMKDLSERIDGQQGRR